MLRVGIVLSLTAIRSTIESKSELIWGRILNSWPEMAVFEVPETAPTIFDVGSEVDRAFAGRPMLSEIDDGMTVGIAVGSRGIDRIDDVVGRVVKRIRCAGARPVLIPAMGSHGAATAIGQAEVLRRLLPQSSAEVEIDARTETCVVADTESGQQVHLSAAALQLDGLITVSRVRPHTMFNGSIESGLCKMLVVGLGKFDGASAFHAAARDGHHETLLVDGTRVSRSQYKLLGGVAVVENNAGHIASIEVVPSGQFVDADRRLLKHARSLMPRLPLDDWDLLIVEELGKDISGTGMDTNVIGRKQGQPQSAGKIVVLGLSKGTERNAYGLGYADATTQEVIDSMDTTSASANAAASGNQNANQVPKVFVSERAAVESLIAVQSGDAKIIQIQNTKDVCRLGLSRPSASQLLASLGVRQTTHWRSIRSATDGRIARISPRS